MSLHYSNYLHLDALLGCQAPKSDEENRPAHDEMLFIITHQAYELWFKQIIFELTGKKKGTSLSETEPCRAVLPVLIQDDIPANSLVNAVSSLERIHSVLELLLHQVDVLETMQPLEFLDFRDILAPASGFQSGQYRIIETLFGLRREQRVHVPEFDIESVLNESDRGTLDAVRRLPSVHELCDAWLARTPFIEFKDYDFWSEYEGAVNTMLKAERKMIDVNPFVTDKESEFARLDRHRDLFRGLFDEATYDAQKDEHLRRFSYRAFKAALFISTYRKEPMLQAPYRLLSTLVDIDEALTRWRHRHALMVQRMIGTKVGTGGSKGLEYLRETTYQHRIFPDLLGLPTYFIPAHLAPKLPRHVLTDLQLYFEPNV